MLSFKNNNNLVAHLVAHPSPFETLSSASMSRHFPEFPPPTPCLLQHCPRSRSLSRRWRQSPLLTPQSPSLCSLISCLPRASMIICTVILSSNSSQLFALSSEPVPRLAHPVSPLQLIWSRLNSHSPHSTSDLASLLPQEALTVFPWSPQQPSNWSSRTLSRLLPAVLHTADRTIYWKWSCQRL